MTTFLPQRRPLIARTLFNSPSKPRVASGSKRPRSPEPVEIQPQRTIKRVRPAPPAPRAVSPTRDLQKEKKHAEREQKEAEFRDKYTRAFPSWKFYFDEEGLGGAMQTMQARVLDLGGHVDQFFSSSITHLITDKPIPTSSISDKENIQNGRPTTSKNIRGLKSPMKFPNRGDDCDLVNKAMMWGIKIWNASKLNSVLSRCLDIPSSQSATSTRDRNISQPTSQRASLFSLLQTEKIHGTSERDPTQKRHDYHYFTRGSCFVLLEDISQELATIAAHEYPIVKDKDDITTKKPWPVLHCHPHARNPFAPFDEKEKKRWEKQQQADKDEEVERARRKQKLRMELIKRKAETKKMGDLRRSASLNNLHRRLSHPMGQDDDCIDLDADEDDLDSANASGYLPSGAGMGYLAASGNSVGITSTTGTTSTSGQILRKTKLPAAITDRMKHHVVTSRKVSMKEKTENAEQYGVMGPPKLPAKPSALKKSKSMNNVKLPKREEGVKPGYCESCRVKFSDFSAHLESKKHIKFASNPTNYEALDFVLGRLRRRTRQEIEAEKKHKNAQFHARCVPHLHLDTTRTIQLSTP